MDEKLNKNVKWIWKRHSNLPAHSQLGDLKHDQLPIAVVFRWFHPRLLHYRHHKIQCLFHRPSFTRMIENPFHDKSFVSMLCWEGSRQESEKVSGMRETNRMQPLPSHAYSIIAGICLYWSLFWFWRICSLSSFVDDIDGPTVLKSA